MPSTGWLQRMGRGHRQAGMTLEAAAGWESPHSEVPSAHLRQLQQGLAVWQATVHWGCGQLAAG